MSDILAGVRDSQGQVPNDKLAEANAIIEKHLEKAIKAVGPPEILELFGYLEGHVASSTKYLAAIIMDLSNEMTEMWNFMGKMAGGKAHKVKRSQNDLEEVVEALKFSRLMSMYHLFQSRGYNDSGLIL